MSDEEKKLYLNNPHKLKPFCILGKHRLPFMAGNSSLAKAWQQESPPQEWIQRYVIEPGKEICLAPIDSFTRHQLVQTLQKEVLPNFFSKTKQRFFLSIIQQLPSNLSIQSFRNRILQIFRKLQQTDTTGEKFARQLDTALCQSLEPDLKNKLKNSAVHFADTNWCSGSHDLHFCFAINPGTGQLELWEAYDDGTHLMALDQKYWLFNQKWEFLTMPEELANDDFIQFYHPIA